MVGGWYGLGENVELLGVRLSIEHNGYAFSFYLLVEVLFLFNH